MATTAKLEGSKVAILLTDGFEQSEYTEPKKALEDAGVRVVTIAPHSGEIYGMKHHDKGDTFNVDKTLDEVDPRDFDALMLPGGALNADALRANPKARAFVQIMIDGGKPIAAICHAPWLLASAGVLKGRTVTSYPTIRDDLLNARANWVDREVVRDRSLVTSRKPADLPAFNREMLKVIEEYVARKHNGAGARA